MIKKKMSLLLAAVLVASGVVVSTPVSAATVTPKVTYVAPAITMAEVGDEFSFALQSDVATKVQYQIWAQNTTTGKWYSLTNGYTEAVKGTEPFIPAAINNLPAGAYNASVWVKAEDSTAKYDSFKTAKFKIQANGYFDGRAKLDSIVLKDTYKVGENVEIAGNDLYMIHTYSEAIEAATGNRAKAWNNDTHEGRDGYEDAAGTSDDITFTAPGKYLVNVWGKKADSKNKYDGWKLKVVTVEEASEEVKAIVTVDAGLTAFDRYVKVELENVKDPENYNVTVMGTKLTYVASKGFFQGLVNSSDEAAIKADVKVVYTKVEVPTATATVEAGLTAFDRYVKVTLATETPEAFDVTVKGTKLTYVASKGFFQGLVNSADEAAIKADVVVTVK